MPPGPPPKPPGARRRYGKPASGEWQELHPLDRPVLPALGPKDGGWSARARATWAAWREDPVTATWSPADVAYARETVHLVDRLARNLTAGLAAEVRLRLDGLGLTPKGRQALRLRIVSADELVQRPAPGGSSEARKRRLRVVDADRPTPGRSA